MTAVVITATRLRESQARGVTIQTDEFLTSYGDAARSLARTLDQFLERPDERAVHEVRTAIGRFDAHLELLPRKTRESPGVRKLLRKHQKVLKRSRKVRDLCVVRAKVARCPQHYLAARLLKKLDKRRSASMKKMKRAVVSARRLSAPAAEPGDLEEAKLQSRFSKVTGELTQTINRLLPDVGADPNLVTAMSRLRADGARLRFTLELARVGGSAKVLSFVEEREDALRAIHDLDVTISCLKEFDNPVAEELVMSTARERVEEFRAFARSVLSLTQSPPRESPP